MSKYRTVKSLPDDAVKVSQYAKGQGCGVPNIYKVFREAKKKTFEIVNFKGINFIIPKAKKHPPGERLPAKAMRLKDFCEQWNNGQGCTPQNIYKLLKENRDNGRKIPFTRIIFKGTHFYTPHK